jgi:hypothetical protein
MSTGENSRPGRILRSIELKSYGSPREATRAIARGIKKLLRAFPDETFEGIGVSLVGAIALVLARSFAVPIIASMGDPD